MDGIRVETLLLYMERCPLRWFGHVVKPRSCFNHIPSEGGFGADPGQARNITPLVWLGNVMVSPPAELGSVSRDKEAKGSQIWMDGWMIMCMAVFYFDCSHSGSLEMIQMHQKVRQRMTIVLYRKVSQTSDEWMCLNAMRLIKQMNPNQTSSITV